MLTRRPLRALVPPVSIPQRGTCTPAKPSRAGDNGQRQQWSSSVPGPRKLLARWAGNDLSSGPWKAVCGSGIRAVACQAEITGRVPPRARRAAEVRAPPGSHGRAKWTAGQLAPGFLVIQATPGMQSSTLQPAERSHLFLDYAENTSLFFSLVFLIFFFFMEATHPEEKICSVSLGKST